MATITTKKTILSIDTNKKYAGCHFAQMAAANASPCLSRDFNTRNAALVTTAVAANANDAVIVWLWLLLKSCCESPFAQAGRVALLRNAKMHTPPVVVMAEATPPPPKAPERHFKVETKRSSASSCNNDVAWVYIYRLNDAIFPRIHTRMN